MKLQKLKDGVITMIVTLHENVYVTVTNLLVKAEVLVLQKEYLVLIKGCKRYLMSLKE